jgi:hypothetical protein
VHIDVRNSERRDNTQAQRKPISHAKLCTALIQIDLAGGHKMTDDEIREALRLDFEQTADWRRSKAAEYPEDQDRNLEAAALLDKLAASVETVAPDFLDAYGSLRDDYMDSEQHSEMLRQIGFHSWPETAEDFILSQCPYVCYWHAGPKALTVKDTVPTSCTPP